MKSLRNNRSLNRLDHNMIGKLIPPGSHVLDLGCADGTLLTHLNRLSITGLGMEIKPENVRACVAAGLNVLQQDIDYGLADFADHTFDYVILNRTLQATHKPLSVLQQSMRIGRRVLVSFPNFGHWKIRSQLFFGGRMPKSRDLPYEWYDTPNIHLVTIADFISFCGKNNFCIHRVRYFSEDSRLPDIWPNLLSPYAMFELSIC